MCDIRNRVPKKIYDYHDNSFERNQIVVVVYTEGRVYLAASRPCYRQCHIFVEVLDQQDTKAGGIMTMIMMHTKAGIA